MPPAALYFNWRRLSVANPGHRAVIRDVQYAPAVEVTRRLVNALERLQAPHEVRYYPGELHAFHALMMGPAARDCWRDKLAFIERSLETQ